MRSARPLEDWQPAGTTMMFELLARIQRRDLPPTSFLSNSEWDLLVKCPASDLKVSRDYVMDVEDND